MTAVQFVYTILDSNWESDAANVTNRDEDVPKPGIIEGVNEKTRHEWQNEGLLVVKDGGITDRTPKGLNWQYEEIEDLVTVRCQSRLDRQHVNGRRDQNNEAENYGGLTGEVIRILHLYRKGQKEYDVIKGYEVNDVSDGAGAGRWRSDVEIRLTDMARKVNP